ncbi:hypothetical protein ACVIWV_005797 [Bradyrhizobium diazoefficiens]|uniref:hypothetical protein n=1 Tax=Bradyrhizobium diazoefficiens TaxID=1355477 RepID=UPI0007659E80|nr:hypothetical protein [Bradyrhizobium diazoefficiens]MBR0863665.1 hypothetical protein [Bradyrhizobium diazoefficiens]MBR0888295.1 hypothetical protein [Bradyrhizobium diazoefficiens]MBR0920057.1 hypothetical protein [Bradyrhizobium diazoefficiens]
MRVFFPLFVLICLPSVVKAQESYLYGLGLKSCGYWQSSPALFGEGKVWIFGFWSGMNVFNDGDHMVGSQTDAAGIVAEIKKVCEEAPSQSLGQATRTVYTKLSKKH